MTERPILTKREIAVMEAIVRCGHAKAAAAELGIGVQTVKNHLWAIRHALDVETTVQAVAIAVGRGWLAEADRPARAREVLLHIYDLAANRPDIRSAVRAAMEADR